MDSFLQDVRYALRSLRKSPGFAAAALLTLTLGIGGNTAVFSVVNSVLLRPLTMTAPQRVVRLQETHRNPTNVTGATFHDLRERCRSFSQIAAFRVFTRNLSDARQGAAPEQIDVATVSYDFFPLAGISPSAGRLFDSADYRHGAEPVLVLSHELWRGRFGGDRNVIGSIVELHGVPHRVIGIMPPGFDLPEQSAAWTPMPEELSFLQNRRSHLFQTWARLKPGFSVESAAAELDVLGRQISEETHNVDPDIRFRLTPLQAQMTAAVRPTLLLLLGAVGLVLLIACANVANLLLSRAASRQKEIAIRAALGASRIRLARQVLTESVTLALAGGILGTVAGTVVARRLGSSFAAALPRFHAALDWRMFWFALGISLVTALLFGAAPAWQLSTSDLHARLAQGGRGSAGAMRQRVRSALVVSEIAFAVVLLAGAGLLIRSFIRLQQVDPGYDAANVLVVPLTLPGSQFDSFGKRQAFFDAVLDRIRSLPGVHSAAAAGILPLRPSPATDVDIEGKPTDPGREPVAQILPASPEYFNVLGMRLLAGRGFSPGDTAGKPTVILVNQAFARRYLPHENPVGKRIVMKDWNEPLVGEVIGMVADVRQDSLEDEAAPALYYSFSQFERGTLTTYLLVRTGPDAASLASAVREQIWSVDRRQPVTVATMQQILADSLQRRRFTLLLLASFASIALTLAIVGIYGVIAYSVVQRTREFGIRMALGAQRADVLAMVLRESCRLFGVGFGIGIAASLALSRTMRSMLYGVGAADPATFIAVSALFLAAAVAAAWAPARRATRVDPMVALRYE